MADDKLLTENDGDIAVVEESPADAGVAVETSDKPEPEAKTDERLAQDDAEDDVAGDAGPDDPAKPRRRSHKERKASQKQFIDRILAENERMRERLDALEGHALGSSEQSLDARIGQLDNDLRIAEEIIAKATEAGNGQDVVAAMRIRDSVLEESRKLKDDKQRFQQTREQRTQPVVDARVASHIEAWQKANPWYDPRGLDRESALTRAIDAEVARDGFDPASVDYWEELNDRLSEAFGTAANGSGKTAPARDTSPPARKGPPVGAQREHAPLNTRKEIVLSADRVAAIKEAGYWDDPVKRTQMAKMYQQYDRDNATR